MEEGPEGAEGVGGVGGVLPAKSCTTRAKHGNESRIIIRFGEWLRSTDSRREEKMLGPVEEGGSQFGGGMPFMCGSFSSLQQWNYPRTQGGKAIIMLVEAAEHLEFSMKIYEWQVRRKKRAIFKHPATSMAWKEECVLRVLKLPEGLTESLQTSWSLEKSWQSIFHCVVRESMNMFIFYKDWPRRRKSILRSYVWLCYEA